MTYQPMSYQQLKDAIRTGLRPTPGIENELFEAAYREVMHEDHPGWSVKMLSESRSRRQPDGLPPDAHARMHAMLSAAKDLRQQRPQPLSESRRDDVVDPPTRTPDQLSALLKSAGEAYKLRTDDEALAARRPAAKRFHFTPLTLAEARAPSSLPPDIHGIVFGLLRG